MVHHLSNITGFLNEVMRVLTPGGRCVFMDDAYSPIWHLVKSRLLGSLMRYSHRKSGISPEDLRFSMSGGFRESILGKLIKQSGAIPWFQRSSFFQYLWSRGTGKLLSNNFRKTIYASKIANIVYSLDKICERKDLFRRNLIRLVWGLKKPYDT
jgi:ubiquinone/menaquinone biosynthesis C-methylase UbiE